MRRLRRFLELSWEERVLLGEAAALLTAARAALAVVPFRHLAPWLERQADAALTGCESPPARKVAWALAAAGQRLPWRSSCLVRAMAGKLMLLRRGVPATVVVGVARPGGSFSAHAWLRAGSTVVSGAEGAADHAELVHFG